MLSATEACHPIPPVPRAASEVEEEEDEEEEEEGSPLCHHLQWSVWMLRLVSAAGHNEWAIERWWIIEVGFM